MAKARAHAFGRYGVGRKRKKKKNGSEAEAREATRSRWIRTAALLEQSSRAAAETPHGRASTKPPRALGLLEANDVQEQRVAAGTGSCAACAWDGGRGVERDGDWDE